MGCQCLPAQVLTRLNFSQNAIFRDLGAVLPARIEPWLVEEEQEENEEGVARTDGDHETIASLKM